MLPDLSFAHIIVVGLVALIVVGPKDLPVQRSGLDNCIRWRELS